MVHYRNLYLMYLLETTLRKLVYASVTHVNKDCPQMFYGLIILASASINQKLL